jgi:uncharacterized membrane protein
MVEIIPNWHPVFVHFAIGLLISSTLFFVAGLVAGGRAIGPRLTVAGRWNLVVGVLAAVVAVATGLHAADTVVHDEPSHANMTIHMRWAIGTLIIFGLAAAAAWVDRARAAGAATPLLALLLAGAAAITVTGWFGGENVYRHGLGVMRLPHADDHHHPGSAAHDHAAPDGDHHETIGDDHDLTGGDDQPGTTPPRTREDGTPPHPHD